MNRLLALDPGSSCGFCYGDPGGKPSSGIIRLDSKMSPQRRFCLLEDRVRNIIGTYEIDALAVESRYVQDPGRAKDGAKSRFDPHALRLGYGWEAAILMACEREGIGSTRVHWFSSSEWRRTAFSGRRPPKDLKTYNERRDWWKGEALLLCGQRGWGIRSDDQAEACLIWAHGCEVVKPRSTEKFLPLFELCAL